MTEPWRDRDIQDHPPLLADRETEAQREKGVVQCHTASGGREHPGDMVEQASGQPYRVAPESPGPTHWAVWFPLEAPSGPHDWPPSLQAVTAGLLQRLNR